MKAKRASFSSWTAEEIEAVLGKEEADLLGRSYGVTPAGNFEGKTILNLKRTVAEVAQQAGAAVETVAGAAGGGAAEAVDGAGKSG